MKNYTDDELMKAFEEIKDGEESRIVEEKLDYMNRYSAFEYSWSDVEDEFVYEMARRWYNYRQNLSQKAAEKMKCKHCGKEQDERLFQDDPNGEICDICFRDFFPLERKLFIACRHAAELLYFVHGDILNSDCREDLEDVKEVESLCDTVAEVAGKLSILYSKEVKRRRDEKC